jgi:hypothetical protein
VKLSIDDNDFSKDPIWAFPLKTTLGFFKDHETSSDTVNTNSGFLYS